MCSPFKPNATLRSSEIFSSFWQTAHTLSMTSHVLGCVQSRCWQPFHKSVGRCHMQLIYLSSLTKRIFPCPIEVMKAPWTPMSVCFKWPSHVHMCIVRSVHHKLDTQTVVRGDWNSDTLMSPYKVNNVPNYSQRTHSHNITTETNEWAGEMSADMHGWSEQINTQVTKLQQSVPWGNE